MKLTEESHSLRQQLSDVLTREIAYARNLAAILTREQCALTTRDAELLDKLVIEKKECVEAIDELDQHCKELMQSRGFTANLEGFEACIQHCDTHGEIAERWTLLKDLLRRCAKQNRTNGSILELNHRAITRLLDTLGTQASRDQLYGAKGQAIDQVTARTLAKA